MTDETGHHITALAIRTAVANATSAITPASRRFITPPPSAVKSTWRRTARLWESGTRSERPVTRPPCRGGDQRCRHDQEDRSDSVKHEATSSGKRSQGTFECNSYQQQRAVGCTNGLAPAQVP